MKAAVNLELHLRKIRVIYQLPAAGVAGAAHHVARRPQHKSGQRPWSDPQSCESVSPPTPPWAGRGACGGSAPREPEVPKISLSMFVPPPPPALIRAGRGAVGPRGSTRPSAQLPDWRALGYRSSKGRCGGQSLESEPQVQLSLSLPPNSLARAASILANDPYGAT